MIKANFNAYGSYVTDSLYQWDLNQVLQVIGLHLDVAPEVHFANADMDRAIPRQATLENGVMKVNVPNTILQHPLRIHAYIGIYEGDTFKVVEKVEIPVIPKKRPTDYVFEDTDGEIYSYNNLENQIANIRDLWIETHDAQVRSNVYAWLEAHPEVTTTVQDGSLTQAKFSDELKLYTVKDYVTPQMFGAKGDGVTDDTVAIRNAINNGSTVQIPEGNYIITSDILIERDNVKIIGDNATLMMNDHKIVIGKTDLSVTNNFHIRGVKIAYGSLYLKCVNDFIVDKCEIHNGVYGICGSHCYNGSIVNCTFGDHSFGVIFDRDILTPDKTDDHNVIAVRNCKFYNNTDTAFVIRGGFVGEFSFNSVEGNNKGIVVEGLADFKIMSNYFEYNKSDIITLNNYNDRINSSITIGGNRIFGDSTSSLKGMVLTGTIMGLVLQCNSWGGLGVLIDNRAILSGPVLLYQINNTGKPFPNFVNNFKPLGDGLIINAVSSDPTIIGGRLYTKNNSLYAQTNLGDYVSNYRFGYVPTLNVTPNNGDGLLYMLPDGTLRIKINGVEKKIQLT